MTTTVEAIYEAGKLICHCRFHYRTKLM